MSICGKNYYILNSSLNYLYQRRSYAWQCPVSFVPALFKPRMRRRVVCLFLFLRRELAELLEEEKPPSRVALFLGAVGAVCPFGGWQRANSVFLFPVLVFLVQLVLLQERLEQTQKTTTLTFLFVSRINRGQRPILF